MYLKNGKVITFDNEPKMVSYLQKRVESLGLVNVDVNQIKKRGNLILKEKVDLIMCVDVYNHIEDRAVYFSHLIHSLKVDGKIVIIDRAATAPVGPPAEHRPPPDLTKKEMEQAGFKFVEELGFLLPYQFYLTLKRNDHEKKF